MHPFSSKSHVFCVIISPDFYILNCMDFQAKDALDFPLQSSHRWYPQPYSSQNPCNASASILWRFPSKCDVFFVCECWRLLCYISRFFNLSRPVQCIVPLLVNRKCPSQGYELQTTIFSRHQLSWYLSDFDYFPKIFDFWKFYFPQKKRSFFY